MCMHRASYDRLTTKFWRAHRSRRYHNPPLPTVPSLLDEEVAFNTYFQSLHTATDFIGSVLRKHRMVHLDLVSTAPLPAWLP